MLFSLLDPEVHPQPETYWGHVNPIGPRACYDEGKRVAETMCYAYQKQVLISFLIAYKAFCTMLYIFTHFFGLNKFFKHLMIKQKTKNNAFIYFTIRFSDTFTMFTSHINEILSQI